MPRGIAVLQGPQMFWADVSRALRNPSRYDANLHVNFGSFPGPGGVPAVTRLVGNPQFEKESVIAYEARCRRMPSRRLSIDIAAYFSNWDNVQSIEPAASFLEAVSPPLGGYASLTWQF